MTRSWLLVVLAAASILGSTRGEELKRSYDGYKVVRIHAPSKNADVEASEWLRSLASQPSVEIWGHRADGTVSVLVEPTKFPVLKRDLEKRALNYTVTIHDLQVLIEAENVVHETSEQLEERAKAPHRLTWKNYHRYEGIHAREWISPATVTYILNELIEQRENHPDLLEKLDWYFLPVSNPDGYEYTHTSERLWRKTRSRDTSSFLGLFCRGVDPNRNWGHHWGEAGSSSITCSDIYAGPEPFSEPETRAMRDFILTNKDLIKVYLTFHSYSQMWLTPWGFTDVRPDDYEDLYNLGKKAASAIKSVYGTEYQVGTSTELIYKAAGGSDDWAKGVAGIKYSYTVELRDTGDNGFILPATQILESGKETWEGVKVMAQEIANNPDM